MTTGGDGASRAGDEDVAGSDCSFGRDALSGVWPALQMALGVPLWMGAELDRLRAAFPGFSFGICRGWRGLMFEAWRDPGADGLYAVITPDPGELWRELGQSELRPVTNTSGDGTR